MSLRRYSEYRDSCTNWFKLVPAHWGISPLKYLVGVKSGGTPSKENRGYWDGEVPWASSKDLKSETLADTQDHIDKRAIDEGAAELVDAGAVLIVVRGMILAHTFPVVKTLVPMAINQDLKALTPRQALTPDFLAWLLRGASGEMLSRTDEAAHGTKVLRHVAWTSIELPVPPLDEQALIGEFLNRETSKIDALVAEQQRLLQLLKEKRQAIISDAVTKGLNPDVPMKDSGIEWLREVPAHWTISPLKWLTNAERPIMYGIVLPGPDVAVGIPILKGGNVRPSRMNLESMARTTPEIEAPYARARLRAGDLVYSIRGSIGDCELVPDELEGSNITQDVARVAASVDICAPWLRWALLASPVKEQLASQSLGATIRGVNIFDLKRANIPTPSLSEQKTLARFLDTETAKLDALTAESQRGIDLLLERRTALISAAVTGQIDLRNIKERRSAA